MFKIFFYPYRIACLVFFILFSSPFSGKSQNYLWPTDASKLLTSSFCEFRPRHYHAAIDIKTWNRTGYRIYAIEDGYIMRARISAFGYGKAVYLKLKDGNIVIYAHLNRFWPELENYLDNIRRKNKTYQLDLQFPGTQFPVKQGQVLGYTGKTGIGYPHLHFEIRNSRNMPINPLQFYPGQVKDNIPPGLYDVALFPMDYQSLINQHCDTLFHSLTGHTFTLPDTPVVSGRIGVAVKSYDQAEGAGNQYSFYQAHMWIDDSLVYSVKYDRFSYARSDKVELDKNFSLWRKGDGIFHNFFLHPENHLPHYEDTPANGGILNSDLLREGIHHLKIELDDYSGNQALFEMNFRSGNMLKLNYDLFRWLDEDLYLRVETTENLDTLFIESTGDGKNWTQEPVRRGIAASNHDGIYQYTFSVSPGATEAKWLKILGKRSCGIPTLPLFLPLSKEAQSRQESRLIVLHSIQLKKDWLEFVFDLNFAQPLKFFSRLKEEIPQIFWFPRGERTFQINWPIEVALSQQLVLEKLFQLDLQNNAFIRKSQETTISSDDGFFKAFFPENAFYDDMAVSVRTEQHIPEEIAVPPPYQEVGSIYEMQPFDQPVNEGVWITLIPSVEAPSAEGTGLYYWDNKKGWLFIPTHNRDGEGAYSARVTSLEKFILIRDTIPPVMLPLQQITGNVINSQNGFLSFQIKDEMSGIQKESQINAYINGEWQLFEFDPEEDQLTIRLPEKSVTPAALLITAEDNVGNSVTKEYMIK